MSGTEWTEPGKGATVGDVLDAYCAAVDEWNTEHLPKRIAHLHNSIDERARINLRLTGSPLTAEDLKRIETCDRGAGGCYRRAGTPQRVPLRRYLGRRGGYQSPRSARWFEVTAAQPQKGPTVTKKDSVLDATTVNISEQYGADEFLESYAEALRYAAQEAKEPLASRLFVAASIVQKAATEVVLNWRKASR